jgi:hypothetical protein
MLNKFKLAVWTIKRLGFVIENFLDGKLIGGFVVEVGLD